MHKFLRNDHAKRRLWPFWLEQNFSHVMSPTCKTLLTNSRFYLQSSKAQTLHRSTTLASTTRSPPMLRLTTSTSEKVVIETKTIPTPRFRSSSTRNSCHHTEGRSLKNCRQRFRISELHFDKFPIPQSFSCWKIRFTTEVCSGQNFLTEAMLWIKEVEMVDGLKLSRSIQGFIPFLDFEFFNARSTSA